MPDKHIKNKQIPPYMSFKTLTSFIDKLSSSTTPPVIDKSLLSNMSGSGRSSLMSALRYLNLIDENDAVDNGLRNLVKSYKTDAWNSVLYETLNPSYSNIVADLDINAGTDAQLQQAFKIHGGVEGHMQANAIRFFLSFLKESGVSYSPHFGMRRASPPQPKNGKRTTKRKAVNKTGGVNTVNNNNDCLDQFPHALAGMLKGLPQNGDGWPKEKRDQFVSTFSAVLDFCYPIIESGTTLEVEEYDDGDENLD